MSVYGKKELVDAIPAIFSTDAKVWSDRPLPEGKMGSVPNSVSDYVRNADADAAWRRANLTGDERKCIMWEYFLIPFGYVKHHEAQLRMGIDPDTVSTIANSGISKMLNMLNGVKEVNSDDE